MSAETAAPPLVELFRCPTCGGDGLDARVDELACGRCGDAFPVVNGIARFQRTFDEYSENYDRICEDDLREPKTPAVVKRVFAELVVERAEGVVCDLGCGDGFVLRQLEGLPRVAVDIALPYLERLPSGVVALWSRVESTPLRSASIDTVVCTDVLEHVLDAGALAREIERLVKPSGRVLLAFPFEQDLGVYDLPEYRRKYGKYKFVHLRSIGDAAIADLFPAFEVRSERLITEGMALMEFKPFPIKFVELVRRGR